MVIHIVGLGPGGPELMTTETRNLLVSGLPVILRTRRHPAAEQFAGAAEWDACDDLYAGADSFDSVYEAIASRVVERARGGDVIYAVPGHPLIAEASVVSLLASARASGIPALVHAAVSFVDAAAALLGQDLGGIQLCDALDVRIDAQRPALISQVFDRDVAAALKLALLEVYPANHEVTAVREAGTAMQRLETVPLSELDHVAWSYLDSVFAPPLAPLDDVRRFDGLHAVVHALHAPGGCPWDREQTHGSLRRYLLEESYELLEAIDAADEAAIEEELGDVLLQVLMHTSVAEREGTFSFADVAETLSRKLIRRHPHVFGDGAARTAEEVHQRWHELKKAEKPRDSVLDGVPLSLPALAQAQSVQGRARRTGFDWPDMQGPLDKLVEELQEFAEAPGAAEREAEFGDILFVVAGIAQRLDLDAEQALRAATSRFRGRFAVVEQLTRERGLDLQRLPIEEILALWDEAKVATATR